MIPEIKLAAFDLGNVIVDVQEQIPARKLAALSGESEQKVFDTVFAQDKKSLFESGKLSWETHAANAIAALGLTIDEPELRSIYRESLIPDLDVVRTVCWTAKKVQIALASNTSQPHWEWVQEELPFANLFQPAILSHLVGAMKPSSDFYRALIDQSGYEPGEIFFTDDRPENIEGAIQAGIRAFQFENNDKLVFDLQSCGVEI